MTTVDIKRTKITRGDQKGQVRHETKVNGQTFTRMGTPDATDTLDAMLLAAYARVSLELDPPRPVTSLEQVTSYLESEGYEVERTDRGFKIGTPT